MKKYRGWIFIICIFVLLTAGALVTGVLKVKAYTVAVNREKTDLLNRRMGETMELLELLTRDERIRSADISYQDKARILTDINRDKGYMMIRILDSDMNVYREDTGLASDLSSRDYLQTLYATGEPQVTDAFLAGADGVTINYTVAVAIKEGEEVTGAIFAAIYGDEIAGDLLGDGSANVLIGSEFQYMSGVSADRFGMPAAQILEEEGKTTVPVENILLDFYDRKDGSFWSIGKGKICCYAYAPVENTKWSVLTEVHLISGAERVIVLYGAAVALLTVGGAIWFIRKKAKGL